MLGRDRRGFDDAALADSAMSLSPPPFAQAAGDLVSSSGEFATCSPPQPPLRPPPCRIAIAGFTIVRRASFRGQRSRLSGRWIVEQAHEPLEVRTWPHHEVVIRYDFMVIALACALPEPVANIACLDPHRCLRSPLLKGDSRGQAG